MKVYAPERVLWLRSQYTRGTGLGYVQCGLPLGGNWIKQPDYFIQATKGNDINDVVHAKLVDATGYDYSVCDLRDSRGYIYPQTCPNISNSGERFSFMFASFKLVERKEYRYPKNYKGRKPITPRLYTWHERLTIPWNFDIRLSQSYGRPCASVYCTCLAPDHLQPRDDRVCAMSRTFVLRWEGTGYSSTSPGYYSLTTWAQRWFLPVVAQAESTFATHTRSVAHDFQMLVDMLVIALKEHAYDMYDAVVEDNFISHKSVPYKVTWVPVDEDVPQTAFLLDEDHVIGQRVDAALLGRDGGLRSYWRNYLYQHALLEACQSFPSLNDNSISNIMEIVGFIKSLVIDHEIEIPKSLGSAWLAYRYQYSTTKLDVEEAIKFVHRHMDLGTLDRKLTCYGKSSIDYKDTTITCRVSLDVEPKNLGYLGKIWRALDTYGLTPDFYVIWDSIPFSFIADWFLPISDILATLDADAKYFSGEFYSLSNICCSLSYTRELNVGNNEVGHVKCYSRWKASIPSCLNSFYWFDTPSSSAKTVRKRILDFVSLFIAP